MSKQTDFIKKIAPLVQKIAPEFDIRCCSAVIAQACLESAYGTSNKAQHHNYFGLKYRPGRLTCSSGTFVDGSSEQREDGSHYDITDSWYEFDSMENGVRGYFQFTDIANYANLKGVADPETYLTNIKKDGYATSLDYVKNVMAVVTKYNLTQYDNATQAAEQKEGDAAVSIKINKNKGFQGYNVSSPRSKPEFIVCHYVGADGSAANNVSYFNEETDLLRPISLWTKKAYGSIIRTSMVSIPGTAVAVGKQARVDPSSESVRMRTASALKCAVIRSDLSGLSGRRQLAIPWSWSNIL